MSSKKRSRKGIESIEKRIEEHKEKLRRARESEDIGLVNYYEKEIEHFERAKKKLEKRVEPKLKRKKANRKCG